MKIHPDIIKLGLLFDTSVFFTDANIAVPFLHFQHRFFHDYAGAYFIEKSIERSEHPEVHTFHA